MIRPIPSTHGVGFFSMERLPEYAGEYREEQAGRYWNYHVTPDCYEWPGNVEYHGPYIIDGFSPNLNKSLHVGHLRQLVLAKSLSALLNHGGQRAKFVALLGASQGVYKYAQDELNEWFNFVNYHPEVYYDVLMPRDQEIVPRYKKLLPYVDPLNRGRTTANWDGVEVPLPTSEQECTVWDGPHGHVIVERWDGKPLYTFHDIAFAKTVGPTHYITGTEQKEHFENLGLGDKHLVMGLVLGADGKKMKSRTGDSATAAEVIEQVIANLNPTDEPKKLAWNVLAWNFLHVARSKTVKFTPEEWTKPEAPGMYITYTYARLKSALKNEPSSGMWFPTWQVKAVKKQFRPKQEYEPEAIAWSKANPDPEYDLTEADAKLLGFASQKKYYTQRVVDTLDPAMLANYAHDLATMLGAAYHSEKIQGGRYGFKHAVYTATNTLRECMWDLGMFPLESV